MKLQVKKKRRIISFAKPIAATENTGKTTDFLTKGTHCSSGVKKGLVQRELLRKNFINQKNQSPRDEVKELKNSIKN